MLEHTLFMLSSTFLNYIKMRYLKIDWDSKQKDVTSQLNSLLLIKSYKKNKPKFLYICSLWIKNIQ